MEKAGEDGFGDGSGTAARVIGSCDFLAISPIAGSTRDTGDRGEAGSWNAALMARESPKHNWRSRGWGRG